MKIQDTWKDRYAVDYHWIGDSESQSIVRGVETSMMYYQMIVDYMSARDNKCEPHQDPSSPDSILLIRRQGRAHTQSETYKYGITHFCAC